MHVFLQFFYFYCFQKNVMICFVDFITKFYRKEKEIDFEQFKKDVIVRRAQRWEDFFDVSQSVVVYLVRVLLIVSNLFDIQL